MSITRNQASGAYQRWTPPSFDDPAEDASDEGDADEHSPTGKDSRDYGDPVADATKQRQDVGDTPSEPDFHLPTAEEIETMYEQARAEGHAAGMEEGRAAGVEEGRAAGYEEGMKAAREQVQRLTEVVGAMDLALDALDAEVAEELAGLAIALTREMVGRNLRETPEAVATIVREALQHLPQGKARILLNPEDIAIIRDQLDDVLDSGHHKLVEDASVARGGCHIETSGADIDATLHTRWLRVLRGIGREGPDWDIAPDNADAVDAAREDNAEDDQGAQDEPGSEPEPPRDA